MLSLLYGPNLKSIHDYQKNYSFVYGPLSSKRYLCFIIHCLGLSSFPFKEQSSFNFMATVTICSDFGAQENKMCHCFWLFPFHLPWSDGTGCYDLCFFECWALSQFFFSLSSFTFIKKHFSSSLLSAIRVVSSAYLKSLIFFLAILITASNSSSLVFHIAQTLQNTGNSAQCCSLDGREI